MLDAVMHIRRCIRLYQRLWAGLEQLSNSSTSNISKTDEDMRRLAQRLDALQTAENGGPPIQVIKSSGYAAFNGPLLWNVVSALYMAMRHASKIYQHQGMFKEAEYYLDEAVSMAEATNSTPIIAQALTLSGDLRIRSGSLQEGEALLARAAEFKSELENSRDAVAFQCIVANMHRQNDLLEKELEHYESAERKLDRLMDPAFVESLGGDSLDGITDGMDDMEIGSLSGKKTPSGRGRSASVRSNTRAKTPAKSPARSRTPTKTPTKRGASKGPVRSKTPTKQAVAKLAHSEFFALDRIKGNILRLKADNMALQGNFDEAEELLKDASEFSLGQNDAIAQKLVYARRLYFFAIALLGDDPALSALQDSTLSLPNIACTKFVDVDDAPVKKAVGKGKGKAKSEEPLELLCKARDALLEVHMAAVETGSTMAARSVSVLISSLLVLISALNKKKVEEEKHQGFAGFSLGLYPHRAGEERKVTN